MDLPIVNKYIMADGNISNAETLLVCTDEQRLSLDEMSFGEFTSTNVPTVLKGSRATVNGCLFGPASADAVPLYIANAAGSSFQDVSNAPSYSTLYLCLIPSITGATFALKACAAVSYNAEYRGFYETGTQNRVFGECRKVSGAYPVKYKKLYPRPDALDSFAKLYADGLEINIRKMNPVNNSGLIASTVFSASKNAEYGAAKETLFKIRADYPMLLEMRTSAKTWTSGGQTVKTISGCSYSAVLLNNDESTEIGSIPLAQIEDVPASNSASSTIKTIIPLLPGTYNIKLKTVVSSFQESPYGGSSTTSTYGLYVGTITANVRNVMGDRTGSWGAVL